MRRCCDARTMSLTFLGHAKWDRDSHDGNTAWILALLIATVALLVTRKPFLRPRELSERIQWRWSMKLEVNEMLFNYSSCKVDWQGLKAAKTSKHDSNLRFQSTPFHDATLENRTQIEAQIEARMSREWIIAERNQSNRPGWRFCCCDYFPAKLRTYVSVGFFVDFLLRSCNVRSRGMSLWFVVIFRLNWFRCLMDHIVLLTDVINITKMFALSFVRSDQWQRHRTLTHMCYAHALKITSQNVFFSWSRFKMLVKVNTDAWCTFNVHWKRCAIPRLPLFPCLTHPKLASAFKIQFARLLQRSFNGEVFVINFHFCCT